EPAATATVAATTAKPATTTKALTAAGASQSEQRARQHERQRQNGAQGQPAAPGHDFSGGPPPVRDWPQLVQNLPSAAFYVPHVGQATVAPVVAGAGERAGPPL